MSGPAKSLPSSFLFTPLIVIPNPQSAFDDYFKAFSVAVMPGNERPTLSYGGKIILPPSALVSLTQLDLESPWTFQLRNPKNPSLLKTHAGVLEFIADEGCCYLPYWVSSAA